MVRWPVAERFTKRSAQTWKVDEVEDGLLAGEKFRSEFSGTPYERLRLGCAHGLSHEALNGKIHADSQSSDATILFFYCVMKL